MGTIELNPLGPGCVWGLVDWQHDSDWLLGRTPIPDESRTSDTHGGEARSIVVDLVEKCVVRFTAETPPGLSMGGLAHMPPEYMLVMFESMGLDRVLNKVH